MFWNIVSDLQISLWLVYGHFFLSTFLQAFQLQVINRNCRHLHNGRARCLRNKSSMPSGPFALLTSNFSNNLMILNSVNCYLGRFCSVKCWLDENLLWLWIKYTLIELILKFSFFGVGRCVLVWNWWRFLILIEKFLNFAKLSRDRNIQFKIFLMFERKGS